MPFGRDTHVVPFKIAFDMGPGPPMGTGDLGVGTPLQLCYFRKINMMMTMMMSSQRCVALFYYSIIVLGVLAHKKDLTGTVKRFTAHSHLPVLSMVSNKFLSSAAAFNSYHANN